MFFRLRLRFLSGNLLFLQKIKHELRRTTRSRQRFAVGRGRRGLRRRRRLYRRCKVRSAPCGGQQCGADRPCRGVCPPLWRAGACHAQYPDLRRRTGDRRAAGPRADRGRGRCAHRAGHGSAADGSSGRAARLDAGVQHDARTGAFLRRMRFCPRDSRTGAVARRDPGDMRRDERRSGVFRPRGHLRGLQRPLFSVAVDVRAERQPRRMQPAVPPDLRSDRRQRTHLSGRKTPALGPRPESFGTRRRAAGCRRQVAENRGPSQRHQLYPQYGGLLPPRGGRCAGRAAPPAACFGR